MRARKWCLTSWVAIVLSSYGCSLRTMALKSVANSLSNTADTFASDADPELIRDAVPFSLKLIESLLAELPAHRGLLLTACSGFTQYAYAFVDSDAEQVKLEDYALHVKLQDRARNMYLRGRDYCLRALEVDHRGFRRSLDSDPDAAVRVLLQPDVPLMYWTGASWGMVVALSLDNPALAGDFPIVQALVRRALLLDESFNDGAIHEVMITLESLPEDMGGDPDRARMHYLRALELSSGNSAGTHVSCAMGVALPRQDKASFVELLNKALAVDVDRETKRRLANILAQRRAQYLLDHLDALFLSGSEEEKP